jgi:hypothetical protein
LIVGLGRDLEKVHGLAYATVVVDLHQAVLLDQLPAVVGQVIVRLPLAVFEVTATQHFQIRLALVDPLIPVNLDFGLLPIGRLRHWERLRVAFAAR